MNEEEKMVERLVLKARKDRSFKEQLIKEPKKILQDFNIKCDENSDYVVLQETKDRKYFILPSDFSDTRLGQLNKSTEENPFGRIHPEL